MNFTERRKQVFDKMDQDSALLLFSGIELHVSADEYLPFEANRNFFYLTGLRRDHMILMMKKTAKEEKSILFIEKADPSQPADLHIRGTAETGRYDQRSCRGAGRRGKYRYSGIHRK